jgi:serine acetyltransferase
MGTIGTRSRTSLFSERIRFRAFVRLEDTAARLRPKLFAIFWRGLSIDSGVRFGKGVRISCAPGGIIELRGTIVGPGVVLEASENAIVRVGNGTVRRLSVISARDSITVGDGTGIAEMVSVRDHDHEWSATGGFDRSSWKCRSVTIGRNSWIGAKATVTPGSNIGDRVIVGAGAVVTRSVADEDRVAGVPARPLFRE